MALTLLIPVSQYGFGRTDQPASSACPQNKWHARSGEMAILGSLQRANETEGAGVEAPARALTV